MITSAIRALLVAAILACGLRGTKLSAEEQAPAGTAASKETTVAGEKPKGEGEPKSNGVGEPKASEQPAASAQPSPMDPVNPDSVPLADPTPKETTSQPQTKRPNSAAESPGTPDIGTSTPQPALQAIPSPRPVAATPSSPEARNLAAEIARSEAKAAAIAVSIRGEAPGSDHSSAQRRELEKVLANALELKLKLEALQIQELRAKLDRLERQLSQRKAQSKPIIERRARELLERSETDWPPDDVVATPFEAPLDQTQTSAGPAASTSETDRITVDLYGGRELWKNREAVAAVVDELKKLPGVVINSHAVGKGGGFLRAIVRDPTGRCAREERRDGIISVTRMSIQTALHEGGIRDILWNQSNPADEAEESNQPPRVYQAPNSSSGGSAPPAADSVAERIQVALGLELEQSKADVQAHNSRYRGGLEVKSVTPQSAADQAGIRQGDILVDLDSYYVIKNQDVDYVLNQIRNKSQSETQKIMFRVIRDKGLFFGRLDLSPNRGLTRVVEDSVNIRFEGSDGMTVDFDDETGRHFELTLPKTHHFKRDSKAVRKQRLIWYPPAAPNPVYAAMSIYPRDQSMPPGTRHEPIYLFLTNEDVDQIESGNFVTKVVYQPAIATGQPTGPETIVSTRLKPGIDPIAEARLKGTILVAIRFVQTQEELVELLKQNAEDSRSTTAQSTPLPAAAAPGRSGEPPDYSFSAVTAVDAEIADARRVLQLAERGQKNGIAAPRAAAMARQNLESVLIKRERLKDQYAETRRDLELQLEGAKAEFEVAATKAARSTEAVARNAMSKTEDDKNQLDMRKAKIEMERLQNRYDFYVKEGKVFEEGRSQSEKEGKPSSKQDDSEAIKRGRAKDGYEETRRDMELQLEAAKTVFEEAQLKADNAKNLRDRKVISEPEYLLEQFPMRKAKIELDRLQNRYDFYVKEGKVFEKEGSQREKEGKRSPNPDDSEVIKGDRLKDRYEETRRDLELQLDSAKAEYEFEKIKADNADKLFKQKVISVQEFQLQQFPMRKAKNELDRLQNRYDHFVKEGRAVEEQGNKSDKRENPSPKQDDSKKPSEKPSKPGAGDAEKSPST